MCGQTVKRVKLRVRSLDKDVCFRLHNYSTYLYVRARFKTFFSWQIVFRGKRALDLIFFFYIYTDYHLLLSKLQLYLDKYKRRHQILFFFCRLSYVCVCIYPCCSALSHHLFAGVTMDVAHNGKLTFFVCVPTP